jgi:acetolactate synthase-1/2/3 large subunit
MVEGAKQLVRALEAFEVEYVFGVCGDTSVGFYRALAELDHDLSHVLARDERSASFMADAYARLSNRPGVCEGPSGGGATFLIPGLVEANDSSIPVIGLNTSTPVRYRGRGVLTELKQERLFDPVTKWSGEVDHVDQIPWMIRQAFRQATSGRPGSVHLSLPMDVLASQGSKPVYADENATTYPANRPGPEKKELDRVAELLTASDRPLIIAGGGVYSSGASRSVRELAESAGIPVAYTLTGAGAIGESPYAIGVIGENGFREYANEIVRESDTIFLLGTAVESVWTKKWSAPKDMGKTVVHIDIDASALGRNYQTTVAIHADLRTTLQQLLTEIPANRKWDVDDLTTRRQSWLQPYQAEFESEEFPMRPERIVHETNEVLDDDAILVSDPGTTTPYFAALYEFPTIGRNWLTPRAHGALGYAVPGCIGAHFARPDHQILGLTGDGSFGTCVGELETIARLDVPVTIVVVNNAEFSWIVAGQENFSEFSFGVGFNELNHAAIAQDFGITGYRIERPDEFGEGLTKAMAMDEPVIIDVPTRPLPTLTNAPVAWLDPSE